MSAAISMMDFGSEYSLVLPFQCDDHLLYLFLCIFFASVFQNFYTFYSNKKVPSDTLMLSKGTMYFHSPRFHPFCFFKPLHLTITESPGRIGAAQSWSSITVLLKPLHHKTGFLSVTFAVIYSSLLRFVFCVRLPIVLDYITQCVVVKTCMGGKFIFPAIFVLLSAEQFFLLLFPAFPAGQTRKRCRKYT